MPVHLGKEDRKNEICSFQSCKTCDTQAKIRIPHFETFHPDHMYFLSDTKFSGTALTSSESHDEPYLDNNNTQLSLILSYTHFLSNCVDKADIDKPGSATVILIGFNSADSIPFLMEMFPMFNYIFVIDPNNFQKCEEMADAYHSDNNKSSHDAQAAHDGQGAQVTSPLAKYFRAREEIKDRDFFKTKYETEYCFMTLREFVGKLPPNPQELAAAADKHLDMQAPMYKYPKSSNPPELQGTKLYLISNYRKKGSDSGVSNTAIISDMVDQLYWMKALRPAYSFVRYKPLISGNNTISHEDSQKLNLLRKRNNQGDHNPLSYFDYPTGYLFKVPKGKASTESAFLITNTYDKTMRIYHENLHSLFKYQNFYTRKIVCYEDIFSRLRDESKVALPYSKLCEQIVSQRLGDKLQNAHHLFYITTSWDDTVMNYIILCYLKLFGRMNYMKVLDIIVNILIILRLKNNDYSSVINGFLGN